MMENVSGLLLLLDVAFLRQFRALFCHARVICAARFKGVTRLASLYVEYSPSNRTLNLKTVLNGYR